MAILVFNPGSTVLRVVMVDGPDVCMREEVDTSVGSWYEPVCEILRRNPDVHGVGCRVVHGGDVFSAPTRVTPAVIEQVRQLSDLAPLHNPRAVEVLEACLDCGVPTVAVFDTAFHQSMPPHARTYGINAQVAQYHGIRRYGFHGIAHQELAAVLEWKMGEEDLPRERLVTCQLGGGASLCAVLQRKSVDTTMGMTPLEGLVMATRSGDLDPGIILHFLRKGWTVSNIERLLQHDSGLAGLSGVSHDPRHVFAAADSGNAQAALAIEVYTFQIAKHLAALTVSLGGLDGIAFSGGVGQHSARVRELVAQRLQHLGVQLDRELNQAASEPESPCKISSATSTVAVWVIPAHEELIIAEQAHATL